jgi:hypothetical protein
MNESGHRANSRISKYAAALWAASFLFFLLYSAPHQVHHVFEQLPQAHHHDADRDHTTGNQHNRSSTDSNCVFQISASRCHLGFTSPITSASLPVLLGLLTDFLPIDSGAATLTAAFHIRAPPLA